MTLLLTLLIMAVVAVVAAVATGRITGGLDRPASSLPGKGLPTGPVSVEDVERVRFSPALRGYRMDEVDDLVDRLTDELRRRDAEIAQLRVRAAFGGPHAESLDVREGPEPGGAAGPPGFAQPGGPAPARDLDGSAEVVEVPEVSSARQFADVTGFVEERPADVWRRPVPGDRPEHPAAPAEDGDDPFLSPNGVGVAPPAGVPDERGRER